MLSAEAMRLAAIEVLCPTSAIAAKSGYPTLAGINVFDSRSATLDDLDAGKTYTPVLACYTRLATSDQRPLSNANDVDATAVLEIVAELSTKVDDDGADFADAVAGDDPEARLVLAALVSQVRFLLEHSQAGYLFRRTIIEVRRTEAESFGVPELGVRWQRVTIRITATIPPDRYDLDAGGLPGSIRDLYDRLPSDSYARGKLAALASHFRADPAPALENVTMAPAVGKAPIFSTGDLRNADD